MKSESQVLAVAVWAGLLTHIADLRDIKGDAAVGRKTLPLAFGDITSRWILTFLLMPTALYALWLGDVIAAAPTTIMALHVFLGYRLMHHGNPRYDHKTYMIYTYIFCFILATIAAHGSNVKIPGGLWGYVERSIKSTSLV
ncbi:hypothetical protein Hypma_000226 [Hypsizygus marmoreus]|uniref:Uncharacterized protein n=1 Tax=Hypsizygus marmoreus TaxID=39966 RepID=A0A369JI55_HYPMA|nr:hypothetical protein Hypma_000226 [Hypsizygus marmoreus]